MAKKKISQLVPFTSTLPDDFNYIGYYSGQSYKVSWQTVKSSINKETIGLGSVNNTSDLDKPISHSTETALNNKANLLHSHSVTDIDNFSSHVETTISGSSTISNMLSLISGRAMTSHGHGMSDISGLSTLMSSKSDMGHIHTKADVGLGQVENTSDLDKPLSVAQRAYVDTRVAAVSLTVGPHVHTVNDVSGLSDALSDKASLSHVHGINDISGLTPALGSKSDVTHVHNKFDIGLGNVDNTADINKPISDPQIAYVNATIAGTPVATHAHSIANVTGLQGTLDNKADVSSLNSLATVVGNKANNAHLHLLTDVSGLEGILNNKSGLGHTHNKAEVGLGNADNTADLDKPISNAVQTALNTKVGQAAIDAAIASITGTSPAALDTIQEIAAALNNDPNVVATLTTGLATKASQAGLDTAVASIAAKADSVHTHAISDTVGLQAALDDKMSATRTFTKADVGLDQVDNTADVNKVLSDPTKSYIDAQIASVTASGGSVASVAGKIGVVTLVSADVGLDQVDNTSDINKPVSNATQGALNLKADASHTHVVTKADVGLGQADNTADIDKPLSNPQKTYVDTAIAGVAVGGVSSVNGLVGAVVLTSAEVGLGSVNNTADTDKPVSTATQAALNDKVNNSDLITVLAGKADTTHAHVKADIGLSDVDNTTDEAKPISVATQAALDLKADITYVDAQVAAVTAGTVTIAGIGGLQAALDLKADVTYVDAGLSNKVNITDLTTALAGKADSVHTHVVTKAEVGLGNADNTADLDKPISTAVQTALNSKVDQAAIDLAITNLVGTSPAALDTIQEIAVALNNDPNVVATLTTGLATKAAQTDLDALTTAVAGKSDIGHTHTVTKADVGLGSVDNTADADKPVSVATQAVLDSKVNATDLTTALVLKSDTSHTHTYTKTDVGLDQVDNTTDLNKPLSTLQKTYVDTAIAGVSGGAVASVNGLTGAVVLTSTEVGLGNVNNTSDADKPVSTAVQTALNTKVGQADIDLAITNLVGTSPAALDTLQEIATALNNDPNVVATLTTGLATKAAQTDLDTLVTTVAGKSDIGHSHTVTKADVGLGNVENTADLDKVMSNNTKTYVDTAIAGVSGGAVSSVNGLTGAVALTASHVGLGNVDNTADTAKPVSTAVQTALDLKVNSTDLTTALAGKADTIHTHTKSDIGLSNVDNTADADKPVSTATQAALDAKAATSHVHTKTDIGLDQVDNTADAIKPLSAPQKTYVDTAIAGVSGGGGDSTVYNTTSRYTIVSTAGYKVHCVSSSTVYKNIPWTRTGTDLTLTHVGHTRLPGERVIIKNSNEVFVNALITGATTDTFTVTCNDIGDATGSNAYYTSGFTFAHNSELPSSLTSGVLSVPTNVDIQLHSMRLHLPANSRSGAMYDLTVPVNAYSPCGIDTSNDTVYIPVTLVRVDSDPLSGVGNTIAMGVSGNYATFRYGALGNVASGLLLLLQF